VVSAWGGLDGLGQLLGRALESGLVVGKLAFPAGAEQQISAILQLAGDDGSGHPGTARRLVRPTELGSP
jgi:hypothetical protein